jgi:hypothetical protein
MAVGEGWPDENMQGSLGNGSRNLSEKEQAALRGLRCGGARCG